MLHEYQISSQRGSSDAGILFGLALVAWCIAAWITHIVFCLKTAAWGFLIAGAIMAPIAVIHGTGVWFGAW
jgi:hypothetical protein